MNKLQHLIDNESFLKFLEDQRFPKLTNYRQRLVYVLDKYMSIEKLENSYVTLVETKQKYKGKSLSTAKHHYMNSLNYYLDGKDTEDLTQAIMEINSALLYVPHEGVGQEFKYQLLISMIYQRSVILSTLGDFENALKNANLALNLISSEKLWVQKVYCLWSLKRFEEAIQTIDQIIDYPFENPELRDQLIEYRELIEGESQRYVQRYSPQRHRYIVSDISMKPEQCTIAGNDYTGEGRHMVAIDDIAEGTAILTEKAQLSVLYSERFYDFCSYCFKNITFTYWPCVRCNQCVFCDQMCYERANNYFHAYECASLDFLFETLGEEYTMAFRLIRKAEFTNVTEFCAYLTNYFNKNFVFNTKEWIRNHRNNYNVKEHDKTLEEKRAEFDAILTYCDHKEAKRDSVEELMETLMALYLAVFLKRIKAMNGLNDINSYIDFCDYLITIKLKLQFNCFDSPIEFNSDKRLTSNIYIIGCFINHSCDPNVNVTTLKGRLYFTAAKSIKAGQDVCISYGPNIADSFDERQYQFKSVHFCFCLCSVCRREVTQYLSLKCPQCKGRVYYSEIHPNEDCYQCGARYLNMDQSYREVQYLFDRFKYFVDYAKSNRYTSTVVNIATNIYVMLSNLVYPECNEMIEIKETVESLSIMHYLAELPLFEAIDELFI